MCPISSSSSTHHATPSPFASSLKNLFQTGCFFQSLSSTSSIGTPFVSGNRNSTNKPITTIHAAKKKKMNACAIMNVNIMLELTATANPAVRISLGISQPIGPHDHANDITYVQTSTTTMPAMNLSSDPVGFRTRKRKEKKMNVCTCEMNIWTQAWRSNFLLPTLSTAKTETKVEKTLTKPVITDDSNEASAPKPNVWNRTGA
ncbi:cyclic nucleotide-regulated ion channel family protein [Striga asiatica]|uniref:Cyclic nucleotide-regulated ion channel family protein n=1 Tax=Striga asiatica TaxID=4170 RepID=A0A5A7QH90_STRAF|nr:cyclic nucleotide-regulated ion channel family protein [Striga asiatica]